MMNGIRQFFRREGKHNGWHIIAGLYFLRKANKRHGPAISRGRPSIENAGYLEIGDGFRIFSDISRSRLAVKKGARLIIGSNCRVNGAVIAATQLVVIGNNCRLAPFTHIMDGDFHGLDKREAPGKAAPIVIEDDVWLGARSVVLKGVTIGCGAVVAPGAIVTRDVEPHTLVGGVPATLIRRFPRGTMLLAE